MQNSITIPHKTDKLWLCIILGIGLLCAVIVNFYQMGIVILLGIPVVLFFFFRREYFIFYLIIYTPFEPLILKWLPAGLYTPVRYANEVLLLMLFIGLVAKNLIKEDKYRNRSFDLLFILFGLAAFISGWVNGVPLKITVLGMKNLVRYIFLFYLIINSNLSDKFVKKIIWTLMGIAVFQAVLGISQALIGGGWTEFFRPKNVVLGGEVLREIDLGGRLQYSKVFGTTERYALLGNFLNYLICIAMGLYFYLSQKRRWLFFAIGMMILGLIFSSSRMSWFGTYLGIGFILFHTRRSKFFPYFVIPVLVTVFGLAVVGSVDFYSGEIGENLVSRYFTIFSSDYIDIVSTTGRLFAIFNTLPQVIVHYPLFGLGPGSIASEVCLLYPEYSHAGWLNLNPVAMIATGDVGLIALVAQLGLVGSIIFFMIFYKLFRITYFNFRNSSDPFFKGLSLGVLAVLISLVIHNLAGFSLVSRLQGVTTWTLVGIMVVLNRKLIL